MRLLIHDLEDGDAGKIFSHAKENTFVIAKDAKIHHCLGCFDCWTKTPGACIIRDEYGDMGELFSKCSLVVVISRCYYGGFSPFVKNVFDRSIPYIHPNFTNRNGEMHHKRRYNNHVDLQVYFYGDDITETEKQVAYDLVQANAVNLWWNVAGVSFSTGFAELEGIL